MHVMLLPSWYPDENDPVRGVFVRDQALALRNAGYKVGVLVAPHLRAKRDLFKAHPLRDWKVKRYKIDDSSIPTYHTWQ